MNSLNDLLKMSQDNLELAEGLKRQHEALQSSVISTLPSDVRQILMEQKAKAEKEAYKGNKAELLKIQKETLEKLRSHGIKG